MDSGEYTYIPQLRDKIQGLVADCDMQLLDYTDATDIGGSDEELYDYLHAGEVLGLRVYHDMLLQVPDILTPYSTVSRIEDRLNQVDNHSS